MRVNQIFARLASCTSVKKALFLMVLLVPGSVMADNQLSEIFGEGVFDTRWGESLDEVQLAHPQGKYESAYEMHVYTVKSSRTVLGIDRKNKEFTFQFAEPEEKLNKVQVRFSTNDYPTIVNKLTNILGEGYSTAANAAGQVGYRQWQSADESLTVAVYMQVVFRGFTYLSITKRVTAEATKEELGF